MVFTKSCTISYLVWSQKSTTFVTVVSVEGAGHKNCSISLIWRGPPFPQPWPIVLPYSISGQPLNFLSLVHHLLGNGVKTFSFIMETLHKNRNGFLEYYVTNYIHFPVACQQRLVFVELEEFLPYLWSCPIVSRYSISRVAVFLLHSYRNVHGGGGSTEGGALKRKPIKFFVYWTFEALSQHL